MSKVITILRHGEAESSSDIDYNRALTERGLLGCFSAAKALVDFMPRNHSLDALYHSPFIRTTQTAHNFAHYFSSQVNTLVPTCSPTDYLLGHAEPVEIGRWLDTLTANNILLISHQPLVSNLAAWLVDGLRGSQYSDTRHDFYPASMIIIEADFISQGCGVIKLIHHFNQV